MLCHLVVRGRRQAAIDQKHRDTCIEELDLTVSTAMWEFERVLTSGTAVDDLVGVTRHDKKSKVREIVQEFGFGSVRYTVVINAVRSDSTRNMSMRERGMMCE